MQRAVSRCARPSVLSRCRGQAAPPRPAKPRHSGRCRCPRPAGRCVASEPGPRGGAGRAMVALAGLRRLLAAAARRGGAMPRKVRAGPARPGPGGGGRAAAAVTDHACRSVSGKRSREGPRGSGRRRGTGGGGGRRLREGGGSRQARLPLQRRHRWGGRPGGAGAPRGRLPAAGRAGAAGLRDGARPLLAALQATLGGAVSAPCSVSSAGHTSGRCGSNSDRPGAERQLGLCRFVRAVCGPRGCAGLFEL